MQKWQQHRAAIVSFKAKITIVFLNVDLLTFQTNIFKYNNYRKTVTDEIY